MRIQHNIAAMNTHRNLMINNSNTGKSVEKLSSGYRINRAADDAAGLAISEKMRAQIRGMSQASRNAQDGVSLVQTAEGALQTVSDMLVRIKELATQSANGTYNDSDRAKLQLEVNELAAEITNIQTNVKFNDNALLDGSTSFNLQIGQASAQTLMLKAASFNLTSIATFAAAVNITTDANARIAMDTVASAINSVSLKRAYLGANQNRLENTINNLDINTENLSAAESRIRDTDMAKEMMNFTKNNILVQASQAMLAQANQLPNGVLGLLR